MDIFSQGSALASAVEANKAVSPSPPSSLAALDLSDKPSAEPASSSAAAAADGKEGKKKGGGKGGGASPGLVLGKGTAVLHAYGGMAAGLAVATTAASASVLEAAWKTCREVLEPLGLGCGKLLEEIRAVVEANQVRGCI